MAYAVEVEPGVVEIGPQPGPQTEFVSTAADIAIFGGAAGGGKSAGLLFAAAENYQVPGYAAVIFRREAVQLTGGGSLWEDSLDLYSLLGGTPTQTPALRWTFKTAGRPSFIEFRHLQHENDKLAHQGKQYAFIGFDELTHFSESQFWYLTSRARSTSGVRPIVRATCNPDPDSFVRKLIDWWIGADGKPIPERSGVLRWFIRDADRLVWADDQEELRRQHPGSDPQSLTFIRSRLDDNPALTSADPAYRGRLRSLSLVDRSRLLDEDWNIRAIAGSFFRREWFENSFVDRIPDDVVRLVRGWDLAATDPQEGRADPDWTRGVLVGVTRPRKCRDGEMRPWLVLCHAAGVQGSPGKVEALYITTARGDGKNTTQAFWQDPGQAGKAQVVTIEEKLDGFHVVTTTATLNKQGFAKSWSARAERGEVLIVSGGWVGPFLDEAVAFPEGGHDDFIDAISRAVVELDSPVARAPRSLRVQDI